MMYLSAFYNAQLVTICLRFTKHLKPSTLLEGSMMEILILNFPNNRSSNLQPFGQARGNYFLTGGQGQKSPVRHDRGINF